MSTDPGAGMRPVVRLKDVAEAAGVSVSTASRVLDERGPRSRSAAAERIRAAADTLGYRRNAVASSLRRGVTGTVGVVVPRLSDGVMALMFEAVERAALASGSFAIVATSGDDPTDEASAVERLLDRGVDALVLASIRAQDPLPEVLRERGVPHVLVLRTDGISPSVVGDDEAGGYLAVRHLLDLGHRDIGVLAGPQFASSAVGRLAGARRAMAEAGLELSSARVVESGYGLSDAGAAAAQLLEADGITACFAANDNLAVGVLGVAEQRGWRIGADLSLVGYNDTPLAAQLPVPLSSVRTAFDAVATGAMELLHARPEPGTVRTVLPTLMPRDSSRPFRRS